MENLDKLYQWLSDEGVFLFNRQLPFSRESTTANIYAHVIASAEAKAAQTFDRFNDIVAPGADDLPKRAKKIG